MTNKIKKTNDSDIAQSKGTTIWDLVAIIYKKIKPSHLLMVLVAMLCILLIFAVLGIAEFGYQNEKFYFQLGKKDSSSTDKEIHSLEASIETNGNNLEMLNQLNQLLKGKISQLKEDRDKLQDKASALQMELDTTKNIIAYLKDKLQKYDSLRTKQLR